jgi:hypothetical protein
MVGTLFLAEAKNGKVKSILGHGARSARGVWGGTPHMRACVGARACA